MMKVRYLLALCAFAGLCSCAPKKSAAPSSDRPFPCAEIPVMLEDPAERSSWLAQHFWDRFTAPDSLFFCDSLHVNGVLQEELEKQTGLFARVLEQVSPADGIRAMQRLFSRAEAFQQARPSGNLFPRLTELVAKYFYDPNSPVRSEELYLPYASGLSRSELLSPTERQRYAREAQLCALNRPGTPAADFTFIDASGRRRTLYGIKADLTLLIFGNPDCHTCREIQEALSASETLSEAIASGQLKVVDIYIDEDIDAWKRQKDSFPSNWINGYDPSFVIRTDLLYNVRALPSLYLLDANKIVLVKDGTPEKLFVALGGQNRAG